MISAVTRVVFRLIPCLPLLSDWCKLGPSLDYYIGAEHCGLLSLLLEQAGWAQKLPQRTPEEHARRADDQAFEEVVDWHGLAGRRYHRTRRMLACGPEARLICGLVALKDPA